MNKSIFNALNFYLTSLTNSFQEDITVMNDIYEHPEFSTENDLEGIIFEYGNKIQVIREMSRRLDIYVHDYDEHLKEELAYKLKSFKEKRDKFRRLGASRYSYGRVINSENDFNNPSSICYADTDSISAGLINSENDFNNPSSICNEDDHK